MMREEKNINVEALQINDNLNIQLKYTGLNKLPYVVIDDFYKNPDLLVDQIGERAEWMNVSNPSGYPGYRKRIFVNYWYDFQFIIDSIINKYFKKEHELIHGPFVGDPTERERLYNLKNILKFDIIYDNTILAVGNLKHGCHPRHDFKEYGVGDGEYKFVSTTFLNKPEECSGGIGLYRHKKTEMESVFELSKKDNSVKCFYCQPDHFNWEYDVATECGKYNGYTNDGNDEFELSSLVKMKYNRFVFYPSTYFHNHYIKDDSFSEYARLTLPLFYTLPTNSSSHIMNQHSDLK